MKAEGVLNHYQCGCPLYVLLLLQHPHEERHDIRSELVMNYCPIKTAALRQGGLPGIAMKSLGLKIAALAGIPSFVIKRADRKLGGDLRPAGRGVRG